MTPPPAAPVDPTAAPVSVVWLGGWGARRPTAMPAARETMPAGSADSPADSHRRGLAGTLDFDHSLARAFDAGAIANAGATPTPTAR